jgi:putative peptidoglycan lipid II flippase
VRDLPLEFKKESVKHKILSAAVVVAIFTILAQAFGFAKELAVAAWFGTGDALDAFLIALLIPTFIVNILSGSITAAFLPAFIRTYKEKSLSEAQLLLSGVVFWFIVCCLFITGLLILTIPVYTPVLASGFSFEKQKLTKIILASLMPIVLFKGLSNICAGLLNAFERFALAAVVPLSVSLAIIVFVISCGRILGIYALALGTIAGFMIETVVLFIAVVRRGLSLRPRYVSLAGEMRVVTGQFWPKVAGTLLMGSTELVNKGMAAGLISGSVASLTYGNKIVAVIVTLASTAIGTAVLPYFSKMVADRDWQSILTTVKVYLKLIFGLSLPVVAAICLFSEPLVRIVFARGAFTVQDAEVVSSIQTFFALQIPFYVAGVMVGRLIWSLQANRILMWGGAINLVLTIILNLWFIDLMGLQGIALSTSCVYCVSFLYLSFFTRKLIRHRSSQKSITDWIE